MLCVYLFIWSNYWLRDTEDGELGDAEDRVFVCKCYDGYQSRDVPTIKVSLLTVKKAVGRARTSGFQKWNQIVLNPDRFSVHILARVRRVRNSIYRDFERTLENGWCYSKTGGITGSESESNFFMRNYAPKKSTDFCFRLIQYFLWLSPLRF